MRGTTVHLREAITRQFPWGEPRADRLSHAIQLCRKTECFPLQTVLLFQVCKSVNCLIHSIRFMLAFRAGDWLQPKLILLIASPLTSCPVGFFFISINILIKNSEVKFSLTGSYQGLTPCQLTSCICLLSSLQPKPSNQFFPFPCSLKKHDCIQCTKVQAFLRLDYPSNKLRRSSLDKGVPSEEPRMPESRGGD